MITSCASATSTVCTGAYPNFQCYRTDQDGTIEEWGATTVPPTGGTLTTTPIVFPKAFNTMPSVVVSGADTANGNPDALTIYYNNLTTLGANAIVRCAVNIGGSGCSHIVALPVQWHALGN